MSLKTFLFKLRLDFWPPLLGAGIRIKNIAEDFTSFDTQMKLHPWNKNINGMHFGGSLSAMTDPCFGIILIENLGKNYFVVDKAASIKFLKPGLGTVTAHFNISAARIAEIKKEADENFKSEPKFTVQIKDEAGNIVAEVERTVYVRRRDRQPIPGYKPPQ
jgi:acyl-coenzyme A thioesterase PaaI-like protein